MPDEPGDGRELDRFWNDLVAGRSAAEGYALDPALAETVRTFQALAKHPPARTSQDRVDREVFAAIARDASRQSLLPPSGSTLLAASPDDMFGRNGAADRGPRKPWREPRAGSGGGLAAPLATAALVLLVFVGSLVAIGLGRPPIQQVRRAPLAAPTEPSASSAPSGQAAEFLWQANGEPDDPLNRPAGGTIDPQGNLWVTDGSNGRFVIFSPEGAVLETWGEQGDGEGEFAFTCGSYGYGGVAFDAAGNIYVADAGNGRIQKFSPDRTFLTSWPSESIVDSEFLATGRGNQGAAKPAAACPVDVAVDRQGRIYVSDRSARQIRAFAANGRPLASVTTASLQPEQIALDDDGNIWVADNANRIVKFALDGRLLATWDNDDSAGRDLLVPMAIAVDGHGRVYVADQRNRVQVFSPDGRLLGVLGSPGSDEGEFNDVVSLALDDLGHIYVVEHYGHRVQKFRLLPPFGPG